MYSLVRNLQKPFTHVITALFQKQDTHLHQRQVVWHWRLCVWQALLLQGNEAMHALGFTNSIGVTPCLV